MCKREKGCAREIKENVLKRGGCKRERWVRDRECARKRGVCVRERRGCAREKKGVREKRLAGARERGGE